jgi:hypothetical protein
MVKLSTLELMMSLSIGLNKELILWKLREQITELLQLMLMMIMINILIKILKDIIFQLHSLKKRKKETILTRKKVQYSFLSIEMASKPETLIIKK